MPRAPSDPERELQTTLRNAAAVGLFVLLAVVVIAGVLTPIISDRQQDTTLLLGLAGSIIGAILMLFGVQTILNRNGK